MIKKITRDEGQVANLQLVKETNLLRIFNLIYNCGPISRAEIAHRIKLSPTTVSSLAAELIDNDIVIETGAGETTTSGRKPIMLDINASGRYVVAVEMREKGFISSLFDLKCQEINTLTVDVLDYSKVGDEIVSSIKDMISGSGIKDKRLLGICIGVPALQIGRAHV